MSCNAHQHDPGCDCGFGGATRSGALGAPSYTELTGAYSETPLRQLARELGASITVPRRCWFCGADIYLYASPDGGFAIFEALGTPWPKHDCRGYAARPRSRGGRPSSVSRHGIHVSMPAFRVPVPAGTPYSRLRTPGTRVRGVVVHLEPRVAIVFDGTSLWRLHVRARGHAIGEWIDGILAEHGGLDQVTHWRPEPPPAAVK